ncbi:MAG TPA: hypothetical protein VMS12_06175 [Thermoanaerobaculia bacterium]|nr:hypothetical protein [Thermoanaerobaculia bacterium]
MKDTVFGLGDCRVDLRTGWKRFETCQSGLFDRFKELGLDFTSGHNLAWVLAKQGFNKPAYGWARRQKDDPRIALELAMALGDAVCEGNEGAVALLVWAGADGSVSSGPQRRAA